VSKGLTSEIHAHSPEALPFSHAASPAFAPLSPPPSLVRDAVIEVTVEFGGRSLPVDARALVFDEIAVELGGRNSDVSAAD
jgi:hypothetical protein